MADAEKSDQMKDVSSTDVIGVPKEKTLHNSGNPVFSCALDLRELEFNPSQFDVEGEGSNFFQGYGQSKIANPVYFTSNSNYGCKKPTVHTMPTQFHGKTQKFSEHLGKCGMYRNASFNTATDKRPY